MTGYKTYNSYTQAWEYYKIENTQRQVVQSYDFNTAYKVLEYKQNKFDNNFAKIQNYINHMFDNLRQSDNEPEIINRVIRRFEDEAVDKIPKDADLSQDYNRELIMKFLYQQAKRIMKSEGLLKE
ncbi:hypothetical protein FAQ01_18490 [Flavobacterium aquatile]|nr:hypothetical protein FAQ01_18490 [Flavobacterium aquatile]